MQISRTSTRTVIAAVSLAVAGSASTTLVVPAQAAGHPSTMRATLAVTKISGWPTTATQAATGYTMTTRVVVKSGTRYPHRTVRLQVRKGVGAWTKVKDFTSGTSGKTTISYPVGAVGSWGYRLYVLPTTTAAGLYSGIRPVKSVKGLKTTISKWSTTGLTAKVGTQVKLTGLIRTNNRAVARSVRIQWRAATDAKWTNEPTIVTPKTGALSTTYTPISRGSYVVRATVLASRTAAAASSTTRTLTVTDPVGTAMETGDASQVTQTALMASLNARYNNYLATDKAIRAKIFKLSSTGAATAATPTGLNYVPSQWSQYVVPNDPFNQHSLVTSNYRYVQKAAGTNQTLALAGIDPTTNDRFAVFGSAAFNTTAPRNAAVNDSFNQFVQNTVSWLTPRATASDFKVVIAEMPGVETYYFPYEDSTRNWLAARFPSITINGKPGATSTNNSCDGAALEGCLANADLVILGDDQSTRDDPDAISATVKAAMARGVPVVMTYNDWNVGKVGTAMAKLLNVTPTDNYWNEEGLNNYSPTDDPGPAMGLPKIMEMVNKVANGDVTTRSTDFDPVANLLRNQVRALDADGTRIFDAPNNDLLKMLILLGDKFRSRVTYPVDMNSDGFYRALFADRLVYMDRDSTGVAHNLGTFAPNIDPATPSITDTQTVAVPTDRALTYATGWYAVPGRKFTITRTDSSSATLTVGINELRNTTFVWKQYARPDQLSSARVKVPAGGSVTLTSPNGGPIYMFSPQGTNAQSVTVSVDGVINHPVLRTPVTQAGIDKFKADLASTPTNWAVVSTPYVMLHMRKDMMNQALSDYNGDLTAYVDRINYMVKDAYTIAGFHSPNNTDFAPTAVVKAFCNNAGWDCTGSMHVRNNVQEYVADIPLCGDACSGYPIDMDWAFDPMGFGESHELGHNLQTGDLMVYGGASTEVSNNIFPIHKVMQWRIDNNLPSMTGNGSKKVFDDIVAALNTADPVQSAKQSIWVTDNDRLMFYRQLVEYANYYNSSFTDGWEVYALMYLMDRQFRNAGATWDTAKNTLSMGTYGTYPRSMDGNDFMLISSSRIIGRDMRAMFDLWGITYSPEAAAQVNAYGYPAADKLWFPMGSSFAAPNKVGAPVTMTPTTAFPPIP